MLVEMPLGFLFLFWWMCQRQRNGHAERPAIQKGLKRQLAALSLAMIAFQTLCTRHKFKDKITTLESTGIAEPTAQALALVNCPSTATTWNLPCSPAAPRSSPPKPLSVDFGYMFTGELYHTSSFQFPNQKAVLPGRSTASWSIFIPGLEKMCFPKELKLCYIQEILNNSYLLFFLF